MIERLPCVTIRMWLFPADAFEDWIALQRLYVDVFAVRPRLFLLKAQRDDLMVTVLCSFIESTEILAGGA